MSLLFPVKVFRRKSLKIMSFLGLEIRSFITVFMTISATLKSFELLDYWINKLRSEIKNRLKKNFDLNWAFKTTSGQISPIGRRKRDPHTLRPLTIIEATENA